MNAVVSCKRREVLREMRVHNSGFNERSLGFKRRRPKDADVLFECNVCPAACMTGASALVRTVEMYTTYFYKFGKRVNIKGFRGR